MEKYPRIENGEKLVLEDLNDGWSLAGTIDDRVRAQFAKMPVESSDRLGYVVPEADGLLVMPNGASGTVLVMPFQMYRSPAGGETARDMRSAYFAGSTETVPTPLPGGTDHRWDLLYAIFSETDSDAATRLSEDPVTEVVGSGALNTRHKGVVTLAWVKGTDTAQATDPYPPASWPALPAPGAGEAVVPLAYVHVFPSGTPATVTYNINRIANAPVHARINPQTGAALVSNIGLMRAAGTPGTFAACADVKRIVTGIAGAWPLLSTGKRPISFLEPVTGELAFWLHLGFGGSSAIGASWSIIDQPIITPDNTAAIFGHNRVDLMNRWFMSRVQLSCETATSWAHDQDSAAADSVFPTRMPRPGGAAGIFAPFAEGLGNTIRANADFETESSFTAGDWYVACMFRDLPGAGSSSDMALLVRRSASGGGYIQGAMYVAVRESTSGHIDGRMIVGKVEASPQFLPYSF